ncbi:MAG: TssQ family T6SS-associated lipoprotein [Sulfuricellaceae bacterium]|nr:TssQ family T6SS-associated lipoprotein [Sulfuricellaceae bacterium]
MNYTSLFAVLLFSLLMSGCNSNPEKKPVPKKSVETQPVRKNSEETVKKPEPSAAAGAEQALKAGISRYDEGQYADASTQLRNALNAGSLSTGNQVTARKYLAFIYCTSGEKAACRVEFRKIFSLNPQFRLSASEEGHPAWEPIYREERDAVRIKK